MYKNMLKRSWLSIIRKPGKALLIGLILFAMANLVLASLAIKGAVSESMAYAKSTLDGTVYLQPDMSKMRNQMQNNRDNIKPGERVNFERPTISVSTVKSMADSGYIKDYTYSLRAQANADGFSAIESEENDRMRGGFGPMMGSGEEGQNSGDITISGINSYAFISGVKDHSMSITSGTYFDEKTDDKVIISDDLATSNDLEVGDTIKLVNTDDDKKHSVKIIGTYSTTTDDSAMPQFGNSANTIYMNTVTAAKFLSKSDYNKGDYSVENVSFTLNDASQSDAFIKEANKKYPNLEEDNLALSIDTSAYDSMVGPIESVGSFATTIFWVVVIASIAIITLIVTINVKDRRYEMGVLLSLGASKLNVIGQIAVELVVIGTVAFCVSAGTGSFVAQSMGQGLLDNQVAMNKEQSESNFGRPTGRGGAETGGRFGANFPGRPGGSNRTNDAEAITSINIDASSNDYLLLFLVGYGAIILALMLPSWGIVKYQPKTILAGKE